jgi:hypothetical protein
MAIVGVMGAYFVGSTGWEALSCKSSPLSSRILAITTCFSGFIISRVVMHSFRRVIRRHEEEAIILKATNWDPTFRQAPRMSGVSQYRGASRAWGGTGVSRRARKFSAASGLFTDPFDTDGSMFTTSPAAHRSEFDTNSWRTRASSQLHLIAESRSQLDTRRGSSPPRRPSSPLFATDTWKPVENRVPPIDTSISPTTPAFTYSPDSPWSASSPLRERTMSAGSAMP